MSVKDADDKLDRFRNDILCWYDRNRRVLPWRALPGKRPNPYHVWLSEIMLQQTVVAAVIPYFEKFITKWPDIVDLANAEQEDVMAAWAGLGYYARARNLHKCAKIVVSEYRGCFPEDETELRKLPGIGEYTSAAVRAIAFDKPANVVDGNVERVMARYFAIKDPLPGSKKILKKHAAGISAAYEDRPGDLAQALMDLGATICAPAGPKCVLCPLNEHCQGYSQEIAEKLPYKSAKGSKPRKIGYVYWVTNEKGQVLCERRPEKGLLGGMVGLPTSLWVDIKKDTEHINIISESLIKNDSFANIYHVFTHFNLTLKVVTATADLTICNTRDNLFWEDQNNLVEQKMPTLFQKCIDLMK